MKDYSQRMNTIYLTWTYVLVHKIEGLFQRRWKLKLKKPISKKITHDGLVWFGFIVFNATFKNISAIS
jgi:hypothetical protein